MESPWTFVNCYPEQQMFIVDGGNVFSVEFSRGGVTFHDLVHRQGWFLVNPGDQIRITFSHFAKPSVIRYPM